MNFNMKFGFPNISFHDLYTTEGLQKIEGIFQKFVSDFYPEFIDLYNNRFELVALEQSDAVKSDTKAISNFLTSFAPVVEEFIAKLFVCEQNSESAQELAIKYHELAKFKKSFIQRKVAKLENWLDGSGGQNTVKSITELEASLGVKGLSDLELSQKLQQKIESGFEDDVILYCKHKLHGTKPSPLFQLPKNLDFSNLIGTAKQADLRYLELDQLEHREGFSLTSDSITYDAIKSQTSYCLYCHNRQKDSCSHGLIEKSSDAVDKFTANPSNTKQFKSNPLGVKLSGCPLEEKISEMNYLANQGVMIAALATAIVDNPMLAATGHRICNDCMKACIYQKQEPVDIPKVETGILNEVLKLDYGFEIYSLLTRWNPLDYRPKQTWNSALSASQNSLDAPTIMVAGLGPAGFTLSHYLLNLKYNVIAIDGLKIEPLPPKLSGINIDGTRTSFTPIKRVEQIYEDLDDRPAYGFGGVAEYGITARWNKNYLKIIRLLLERRANFRMYGSVRLGSNITLNQVKNLGIAHVALCFGAGSPNILNIPNILAKGVRTASDFLMSLQLSGAARNNSNSNLQLRMPIAIIGGGLTAIDTATEALEYYVVQVEKVLQRYQQIGDKIFDEMDQSEVEITEEFLCHARLLRDNPKNKYKILHSLGGATICYRKTLAESTAYRLNHEEVAHALAEGIYFLENITPLAVEIDSAGNALGIRHSDGLINARSIFIATGTKPNTVLAREVCGIEMDGIYFAKDFNYLFTNPKAVRTSVIMHNKNFDLSFFGDLHPDYAGNVVKAMASAKDGHQSVSNSILRTSAKPENQTKSHPNFTQLTKHLDRSLLTQVLEINKLAPQIFEIVVRSPSAVNNFKPGQFYRVQNFEFNTNATSKCGKFKPVMEALALTGASTNTTSGLLSLIVLEMGGSSDFCKYLRRGEYISMMGPTGTPTEIPKNKNVMLVGGGLGNAVLFSIGKACKLNGCNVLYFAGYKQLKSIFKSEEIEACADQVVWCCDDAIPQPNRPIDLAFKGNMIEAIIWYSAINAPSNSTPSTLLDGQAKFNLNDIDHMIVIGSDTMMSAVAYNVQNNIKALFTKLRVAIGSINSPMQCMMKEICAQCLQRQIDPKTGKERYVYSCFNQDQNLEEVDFEHLNDRLSQNSVSEKICRNWIQNTFESNS